MLQFPIGPTVEMPAGNAAEAFPGSSNKRALESAKSDQDFADYFSPQDPNKDPAASEQGELDPSEINRSESNELVDLINSAFNRAKSGNLKLAEIVQILNGLASGSNDATKLSINPEDADAQKQQFVMGILDLLQQVKSDSIGLDGDVRASIFGTDSSFLRSNSFNDRDAQEKQFVTDLFELLQKDQFDLSYIERQVRKSMSNLDGSAAISTGSVGPVARENQLIESEPGSAFFRGDTSAPSSSPFGSTSERFLASGGLLPQNSKN